MSATYAHDSSFSTRRTVVFFAIVGVHVLLIYAFASGLATQAINLIAPPIDTTIIDEDKNVDEPPPPPPPDLERPPVQIVAPEINITIPVDAPPPPIAVVTTRPPPPVIVAAPPGTPIKPISIPNSDDYYPSISRQASEEGRPLVKVCIAANGRIESATLGTSSGFERLDEAAVRLAKAGRYRAATSAGQPVAQCVNLPVKFELKKTPAK